MMGCQPCIRILAIDGRYVSADSRVRTIAHPFAKDGENPVADQFSDWEIPGSVPGLVLPDPVTGGYT